jgi:uncharacterized membrane-anchored protein
VKEDSNMFKAKIESITNVNSILGKNILRNNGIKIIYKTEPIKPRSIIVGIL